MAKFWVLVAALVNGNNATKQLAIKSATKAIVFSFDVFI